MFVRADHNVRECKSSMFDWTLKKDFNNAIKLGYAISHEKKSCKS